jgi:chaperonin GroEL (HSP60 family)
MGVDGKYGKVTLEKKKVPDAEPLFVLRAQDKLAAGVVKFYASQYKRATGDEEGTASILAQAEAMEKWPTKKLPD